MKLLKTIGLYALVLAMVITMTACGTNNGGETTTAPATTQGSGTTAAPTTVPATATVAPTTQAGDTTAAPTTADGTTTEPTTTQPGTITESTTTVPVTTVPATTTPAATTAAPTTAPTTAAPTTAASTVPGASERAAYSASLDPVSNKADIVNVGPPLDAQYMLPEVYSGTVTIDFDMKSTNPNPDAMVGFVAAPVVSFFKYYTHMSIQVSMGANFRLINGLDFFTGPAVVEGQTYKIHIVADMNAHTYDISIDGAVVGTDFTFRTRGQNPVIETVRDASDLAMVVVTGGTANMIQMSNLVIKDNTP